MLKHLSDTELTRRLQQGDAAAYNELFDRYYGRLYTFARCTLKSPEAAEDIMQNVFLKLWVHKEKINPELPIGSYLLVVTRNELYDYMRLRYNLLRCDYDSSFEPSAAEERDNSERAREIDDAMEDLPAKRREIFAMRYIHHMTNKEISEALNISIRTVEKHVNLAIKQLRNNISTIIILLAAIIGNQ